MIGELSEYRVTLAHDWLVGLRGGERVLDRLAALFGPTDLYTLVSNGRPLTEAISACRVHTSPLQRFPGAAGRWRRQYLPLMPWAVSRLEVTSCDLLISTSSAVMKAIRAPEGVPHLCYCHSPPRYLWERSADYGRGRGGWWRGPALRVTRDPLRRWDVATSARVSRFLANSQYTAARIKRFWGREARVVYPPVRVDWFTHEASVTREPWLLAVAALEPYKRIELVIEAANRAGFHLKVAGDGSQFSALRRTAGPTVEMLGRVDDETLRDLYRRARALVFPQVEDFGLCAVEAQATGCLVVAFEAGGALETVGRETGVFFNAPTVEALEAAIRALDRAEIDPAACRRNAERFSVDAFDQAIVREVKEILGASRCD